MFFEKLCLLSAILFPLMFLCNNEIQATSRAKYRLNTSNSGKLGEFQKLFSKYEMDLESSKIDLDEIDSDPISVVVHKASSLEEGIVVDDTSLDVEGADVGINVRWLLDNLSKSVGKKVVWTVLLAKREGGEVFVYQGQVSGTIVRPRGDNGFGFDPYFLPEGEEKTLAEEKLDRVNARALAVDAFVKNTPVATRQAIYNWEGAWQEHD